MQKKIIFVHQPKTGGANFAQILKNSFGKKNVYRDKDRAKQRLNDHLRAKGEEVVEHEDPFYDRLRQRVIFGHFSPIKYKERFPDALYITFFRDPIQRIASHYYYWKRAEVPDVNAMHPLQKELLEKDLSLEEFATKVQNNRVSKNYHKNFNRNHFNFSGIMEEYDVSIQLLKAKYLPQLIVFKDDPINVNPEKDLKKKYEVENQEFLETLFKADIDNYNEVKKQFEIDCGKYRLKTNK